MATGERESVKPTLQDLRGLIIAAFGIGFLMAPLRGRLTLPATLAQARMKLKHVKWEEKKANNLLRVAD